MSSILLWKGDAVVAGEAQHGDDLFGPGSEGLTELDQVRETAWRNW